MAIGSYITKTPLTVPGLSLWLDANDPAGNNTQPTNNSALATWVDKSGNKNTAANGNGSQQPLFKTNILNGKPTVRFDGIDDWFSTPNVLATTGFTLFEVKKVLTYADKRGVYYYNGSNEGFYSNNDNNGQGVYFFSIVAVIQNNAQSSDFIIQTHRKLITIPGVAAAGSIIKNDVVQTAAPVSPLGQNAYLTIGADYGGGACGNTDYCEILFYSRDLTNAEITSIDTYLTNKWGVA